MGYIWVVGCRLLCRVYIYPVDWSWAVMFFYLFCPFSGLPVWLLLLFIICYSYVPFISPCTYAFTQVSIRVFYRGTGWRGSLFTQRGEPG